MSLFGLFNSQPVPQIDANTLRERLKNEKIFVLDVRETFEHQMEKIPGSKLIPLGELPDRITELVKFKEKEIVVYCRSGSRSMSACRFMQKQGFNVINLNGGILRW